MERKIDKQESPSNVPSRVIFEVTQYCPFDCEGCFAPSNTILAGPSFTDIVTIGTRCVDAKVPSISWAGGDPYIRKDFLAAVEAIKKYDTLQQLVHTVDTEGVFINSSIARRSAKIFKLARISIYGSRNTFHKWTNASKNISWQTPFTAISYFLESELPVQINIPVYSLDDLNPIAETLYTHFHDNQLIKEVVLIPRINPEKEINSIENYPLPTTIKEHIAEMEQLNKFPVRLFEWKLGKHFIIKADGLAYAHPVTGQVNSLLPIGNPLQESIEDLWKNFPEDFIGDHRNLTPDVSYLNK